MAPKKMNLRTKKKAVAPMMGVHVPHQDGKRHAVAFLNLHVLIVPDGRFWFAQGLEIDYAVQGDSVDDAKKQFEVGFRATIHQNLRIFGDLTKMIRVAPSEIWHEYINTPGARKSFSLGSIHEIVPELKSSDNWPFEQIEYKELEVAVCA